MPKLIEESRELLGTLFCISIVCEDHREESALEVIKKAFEEVVRIERSYSRFIEDNELSNLNKNKCAWTKISDEFFELIEYAEGVRLSTEGAFNIVIENVLEGLGYDKEYSFVQSFHGASGHVELDKENKRVKISSEVDLGGLGKGYAIDRVSSLLAENFLNFCVDGGGDMYCKGLNMQGEAWQVALGHPSDTQKAIGAARLSNVACASSNPYLRKWEGGHHLINPHTNSPATQMMAVYTQAPLAIIADAYATALFAMGYEKAKEWLINNCASTQSGGQKAAAPVEAMIISPTGKIFKSDCFKGKLFAE